MSSAHSGADAEVREEFLEPLRRTLSWLLSLRDGQGRIVCPEHRIEHTGKSACAAILAARLAVHDRNGAREAWFEVAVQQGRRLVANLVREGTSPCHTFRPGRHDPFNCSNSVIDGGACADALSELVRSFGPRLQASDRERFQAAALLHARTYLRYAVLDKGIPAQRAWGLTGLAAAHALQADADLERAALEAVGVLEGIQHADGSYPYHPLEWGGTHAGSADVSAFYQSRVTGFLIFALEQMGRDPRSDLFATPLRRGLTFLEALQAPDGVKCGLVEAKPWYWGATYEVASHPFDVWTFARGWQLFERASWGRAALRAARAWARHLDARGRPASHRPGHGRAPSYQCPLFWAAHACWMARALPQLEAAARAFPSDAEPARSALDLSVTYFHDAAFGRLEDAAVCAFVRGSRPPFNVHHGSPHGAGLLRVVRQADHTDLVERCRLGGEVEAEWAGRAGWPSARRGWVEGAAELRFSLWLSRNHWRGRRYARALRTPAAVLRRGVLAFAAARVSSSFYLAPRVHVRPDALELESGLAWRGGRALPAARLARRFQLDGDGLSVREQVLDPGASRALHYVVPAAAREVERTAASVDYRLS